MLEGAMWNDAKNIQVVLYLVFDNVVKTHFLYTQILAEIVDAIWCWMIFFYFSDVGVSTLHGFVNNNICKLL